MNSGVILDALNELDENLVLHTGEKLGYLEPTAGVKLLWTKRAALCAAAVTVLLIASLVTAMAVSPGFRHKVVGFFSAGTESLTTVGEATTGETIQEVGRLELNGQVTASYYCLEGVGQVGDSMIYASGTDGAAFYDVTDAGLVKRVTTHYERKLSFGGTEFDIKLDCTALNGQLYVHILPENLNVDPYKYAWRMEPVSGSTDTAWLLLPRATDSEYSLYPVLYNVETGELTDVLARVDMTGITVINWSFTEDGNYALLSGYEMGYEESFWLCEIEKAALTPVSDITGRRMSGCYLLDGNIIGYAIPEDFNPQRGDRFDVVRTDIAADKTEVLEKSVCYAGFSGAEKSVQHIEYNGKPGGYLLLYGTEGTTLINLRDSSRIELRGLNMREFLTSESPDGRSILFAEKENTSVDIGYKRLGVLDTESGVLTVLNRENISMDENIVGWLDGERAVIYAAGGDGNWYLYVYKFS